MSLFYNNNSFVRRKSFLCKPLSLTDETFACTVYVKTRCHFFVNPIHWSLKNNISQNHFAHSVIWSPKWCTQDSLWTSKVSKSFGWWIDRVEVLDHVPQAKNTFFKHIAALRTNTDSETTIVAFLEPVEKIESNITTFAFELLKEFVIF